MDIQDLDGWKAYVAGPTPMVEAAVQIGTERGLRPEDLHVDVFFYARKSIGGVGRENLLNLSL